MATSMNQATVNTAKQGLLNPEEKAQLKRRQQRGRLLEYITFLPIVLALLLIIFVFASNINSAYVWQVIDRASSSSGQIFDGNEVSSIKEGYTLELEAQGLNPEEIAIRVEPSRELRREALLAMGVPEFATDANGNPILDDDGDPIDPALDNNDNPVTERGSNRIYSEDFIDGLDERRKFLLRTRVDRLLEANGESNQVIIWTSRDSIEDQYPYLEGLRHKEELAAEAAAEGFDFALNPLMDRQFFTRNNSSRPHLAGFKTAIIGTVWLISLVIFFSLFIGVGTAIYLEEYAPENWFTNILEINLRNLAGVPSIVYGLLGLYTFVRAWQMGASIIAGALTLTLLILPVVIIASREAISAVPDSLRQASYGLGASKWQTVSQVIIPNSITGIVTGVILAIARAIGETAPLIMVGGAGFITTTPGGWDVLLDGFTAMPLQIYSYVKDPKNAFEEAAAAGILTLLILLIIIYLLAFFIRLRFERKW